MDGKLVLQIICCNVNLYEWKKKDFLSLLLTHRELCLSTNLMRWKIQMTGSFRAIECYCKYFSTIRKGYSVIKPLVSEIERGCVPFQKQMIKRLSSSGDDHEFGSYKSNSLRIAVDNNEIELKSWMRPHMFMNVCITVYVV